MFKVSHLYEKKSWSVDNLCMTHGNVCHLSEKTMLIKEKLLEQQGEKIDF